MPISRQDKEELLKDEEFVARLLAKQKPPEAEKPPPPKPGWQRFLETSGGTALITVLIGGMLGQLIAASFQQNQKEREFQQKWMEARGAQALVSYKEYLDQEQQLMRRAYELIGKCVTAADSLLDLTRANFSKEQRVAVQTTFNAATVEWKAERERLELLISYYHKGQKDLLKSWRELYEGVEEYRGCAAEKYVEHTQKPPVAASKKSAAAANEAEAKGGDGEEEAPGLCEEEYGRVGELVAAFNASLEANRQYPWEGWNSPEELRNTLAGKPTPKPSPASTPTPAATTTPAASP